jgi:3-oxoacyl-[acyl-carrier-protein] synthase II
VTKQRVAVTGMGVVTPIGIGVSAFGEALFSGRSGVGPITIFDPATLATRIAAQVDLDARALPYGDRKVAFASIAAEQAMADASSCGAAPSTSEGGVAMGVGLELFSMEDLVAFRRPGFELPHDRDARMSFLQTPSDVCVHLLSARYELRAPPFVLVSACAAGTDALGTAYRLVSSGRRRFMLAGGTDSMINPLGVAGFCTLMATSTKNDAPTRASRPFDRRRDGFVLGEGAAVLALEAWDDAVARGATIHAELAGYGTSFDAHGISEPHPEGRGAAQAMSSAIASAGLSPDDVDVVNAHGTGTPKNDPAETLAIHRVFGARGRTIPVCATKSMIGHLISAAGAVEAVASILGMQQELLHPNPNLDEQDEACPLDVVGKEARSFGHRTVISNSFGFGGQNAAIVLRRAPS